MSEPNRAVVALSLVSASVLAAVTAFQTGKVKHLPEIPLPGFDAEKVHGSKQAYAFFGIPDGLLGMANSAVTASLAALGLRRALVAKTAIDTAAVAGFEIYAWRALGAVSGYALAGGLASATSLALSIAALRRSA